MLTNTISLTEVKKVNSLKDAYDHVLYRIMSHIETKSRYVHVDECV